MVYSRLDIHHHPNTIPVPHVPQVPQVPQVVLSQEDLDLQLPRAQLEGEGVAGPSQHLVRVALVGDLREGLPLAHHASEKLTKGRKLVKMNRG